MRRALRVKFAGSQQISKIECGDYDDGIGFMSSTPDDVIPIVAGSELISSNTYHFWMYIIDYRIDELHFDNRAVDAVFEQTRNLVICHHSAALLYILKEQRIWNIQTQRTDSATHQQRHALFCSDSDSDRDSVSPISNFRFSVGNDAINELIAFDQIKSEKRNWCGIWRCIQRHTDT